MATGPCEILERSEEPPDSLKEPAPAVQKPLKEEIKEADAAIPISEEGISSTPNGIERKDVDTLHVVEQDLDEFVDSIGEAASSTLPEPSLEADEPTAPRKVPAKQPRAEQVAEKVLRAERVVERAPQAEKSSGMEKVAEKVPRVEKAPRVEKVARAEKPAEKVRPAAPTASKTIPAKRKTEGRTAGPTKDTLPWEGLTLNQCLVVASCLAFLSISCQVVQDIVDYGGEILEAQLSAWTSQDSSVGEVEEVWFYERWLNWSDMDEPPDIEEEVEEEEEEEEEEETIEVEEEDPMEEEEEEEPEEEELEDGGGGAKAKQKKRLEKETWRGRVSKEKSQKGRKDPEEGEEEEPVRSKRPPREGKEKEQRRSRPPKPEAKAHKQEEGKGRPKDGRDRGKERSLAKPERDHKAHPHELRGRKPWQVQRPLFALNKPARRHD